MYDYAKCMSRFSCAVCVCDVLHVLALSETTRHMLTHIRAEAAIYM